MQFRYADVCRMFEPEYNFKIFKRVGLRFHTKSSESIYHERVMLQCSINKKGEIEITISDMETLSPFVKYLSFVNLDKRIEGRHLQKIALVKYE